MSANSSGAEPISRRTESLFDLLYVDGRRVATYMAQLDPNGTLTGIKTSASGTTTLTGQGKASFIAVSGMAQMADAETEGSERQFDPVWVLPITLMNRLDELGFIRRGFEGAPVGSLVLSKGMCRLVDIAAVKDMWPAFAKIFKSKIDNAVPPTIPGSRRDRRDTQRKEHAADPSRDVLGNLVDVAKHLPHGLELHMITESGLGWATLDRDCLLASSQDIALKHGSALHGEWQLLSVVDAHPNQENIELWDQLPVSDFTRGIIQLLNGIQATMGRPRAYYGLTPLLLFRTISAGEASLQ